MAGGLRTHLQTLPDGRKTSSGHVGLYPVHHSCAASIRHRHTLHCGDCVVCSTTLVGPVRMLYVLVTPMAATLLWNVHHN